MLQGRHRVLEALYLAAHLKGDTIDLIRAVMFSAKRGPVQVKDFANRHNKHLFVILGSKEGRLSTLQELDRWALKTSCRITHPKPIDELDRVVVETAKRSLQVSNLKFKDQC